MNAIRLIPARRLSIRNGKPLTADELAFRDEATAIIAEHDRPQTVADCQPGGMNEHRPCPFVSCRFHAALDVSRTGVLTITHATPDGDVDFDAMEETCTLDGIELSERQIGRSLNCSGVAVGMTADRAMQRLRNKAKGLR